MNFDFDSGERQTEYARYFFIRNALTGVQQQRRAIGLWQRLERCQRSVEILLRLQLTHDGRGDGVSVLQWVLPSHTPYVVQENIPRDREQISPNGLPANHCRIPYAQKCF